jgi:branched-chain amino acid transport system permease protein
VISTFCASIRSRRRHDKRRAYFLQQLINGLTLGSIYGLIAIGYTMVYGIIGMINFAHGEIYMIEAFISIIAFLVLRLLGVTYVLLALALALVLLTTMFFTSIYGWIVERVAYRPSRGSHRLTPLISAIGMSIFYRTTCKSCRAHAASRGRRSYKAGLRSTRAAASARLSYLQLLIILVTLALIG